MNGALFLDRDGVINADHGYVHRAEDFHWIPGIFDLARWAARRSMPIIVVTNQSGIGRGYYSEDDFQRLTGWMRARFEAESAALTAVYHCPYHPDATIPTYRSDHPWRKPRPGMLLAAIAAQQIDPHQSVMVGDQWTDVAAGQAADIGVVIRVGPSQCPPNPLSSFDRIHQFPTLQGALEWLGRHA